MFTFHKPRVYRSTEGCCICRAKSSSSRFTDSKKYENDSMKCFNLMQPRFGEICNACVLLVKRYKRLPAGSNRHWGHVVDARTGPGTKSLTKYKKYKDDADFTTSGVQHSSTSSSYSSKSFITEKFSKIFKKNKKIKTNVSPSSSSSSSSSSSCNAKRKSPASAISNTIAQSWENHHNFQHPSSLPSTPDSLDSDYEDNHIPTPSSTIVEFQTQTRASAFRSRNSKNNNSGCAISSHQRRRAIKASGSRRRKCMPPRKLLRAIIENDVQFFDENEWQQRQSCCGPVYECEALGGAIIIDLDQYKPCALHQKKNSETDLIQNNPSMAQQQLQHTQKTIITTLPAVVQLASSSSSLSTQSSETTKPTQVLKKHHLFFKRQSECFPHADLGDVNAISNDKATPATKTDLQNSTSSTTAISLKSIATDLATTNLNLSTSAQTNANTLNTKNSMAKITTISPTTTIVGNNYNTNKSTNFLHKIKAADTGKIVKNSLDKINTAVRLKPSEFNEMRNIIKTVDKSFMLNKVFPHQAVALPVSHQQQQNHHANISIVGASQQTSNSTISALSPTLSSSTISSLAPKFSDNSSDSGFDENLQDRKSASPLQEDTEKKMLTRPNISNGKKVYLTAGVNFYGPSQSMLLSGIDEAVNLRQKSRQQANSAAATSHQRNHPHSMTAGGVKIAQIVNSTAGSSSHKMHMRALYNNNTIKHENGVTTILPASSLAASSQTAAMSALVAPSTVTITPAPTSAAITNINGKKVSITGTTPQNMGALHNNTVGSATHLNTICNNVSSLNQKIIFVKTAKYNNHNNPQHSVNSGILHGNSNNNNHHINKSSTQPTTAVLSNVINQTQSVCKN